MKKLLTAVVCCFLFGKAAYAVSTGAESTALISCAARQVLYEDNARKRLGPASTTKIMTAVTALENGNPDDVFTVSKNAQNQEGSSIYLREGDKITLRDLLYGLMLNSGNDAAVAIAEGISGTTGDFAELMNETAEKIGCADTHFKNPSGLPDAEHYSTAYDLALIMAYAMENELFAEIASTKEYRIESRNSVTYLKNHNKLLWQTEDCIGGKTGYTRASGRCLVSCAEKDGVRIVAVTLNDRDDWKDHKNLYEYGFGKLENTEIVEKNKILCTRQIRGTKVNILAGEKFCAPLAGGRKKGIVCRVNINDDTGGKINVGTVIGSADIYAGKYRMGSIPVVSGGEAETATAKTLLGYAEYMLKNILLQKNN